MLSSRMWWMVAGMGALLVGCSSSSDGAGANTNAPGTDVGSGGGSLVDDDVETDPCNGYDDDEDGQVDEDCVCEVGSTQSCSPWAPGSEPSCPRPGTQICSGTEFGTWDSCVTPPPSEDELCRWYILGQEANDQISVAGSVGYGDYDGDGDMDLLVPSLNGDAANGDEGVAYLLTGGPQRPGTTLDLAQEELLGPNGLRIDNLRSEGAFGARRASAALGDLDGDGLMDAAGPDTMTGMMVAFGSTSPSALISGVDADGTQAAKLTDATFTHVASSVVAADFDGDGYAEFLVAGNNSTAAYTPSCPCSPHGVSVWRGRPHFDATQGVDTMMQSGIGHVGQSSLGNFTILGGAGDFNNDGYLDLTGITGASNDTLHIAYVSYAWFGNAAGIFPSAMNAVDGGNGFAITGGSSWGVLPNQQHGDFNGDGVDDLLLLGYGGHELYLIYGGAKSFPASIATAEDWDAATGFVLTGESFNVVPVEWRLAQVGFGDVDGDGFDDLVVGSSDEQAGGLWIHWGRAGLGGLLDADEDPERTAVAFAELSEPLLGVQLGVADIDGDGLGDVVVGAPRATTINGADSGLGVVIFGAELYGHHNPALTRRGAGADKVSGSSAADQLVGGRGDDVLTGGGGADVLYGGQGDDILVVSDVGFARVHGGLGMDTLVLAIGDGVLDFRGIGRARVQEIERFDLSPEGSQTLRFNNADLSAMSSSSRAFWVEGDSADVLQLEGPWQKLGDAGEAGYATYAYGALLVHVALTIDDAGGVSVL